MKACERQVPSPYPTLSTSPEARPKVETLHDADLLVCAVVLVTVSNICGGPD